MQFFHRRFMLTAVLLALALAVKAADTPLSLLPTAEPVKAKVMQIGIPIAAKKIAERLEAALASQPDWTRKFIADNGKPGQPLPYHPNFRVTADEYRAFLAAAAKPTLIQVGSVSFATEQLSNGQIRLKTEPSSSKVNGITIERDGKTATTDLAVLREVSAIDNQDSKGATGRWAGTQWRHQAATPEQTISVKLAIGKRTDAGDGIIYLDVQNIRGKQQQIYSEILLFPIAKF